MKKQPLWFWGVLCLLAAGVAGVLGPRPNNRAEMLGQATAQLLFLAAGVVLIVLHFLRRGRGEDRGDDEGPDEPVRRSKKQKRPRRES